MLVMSYYSQSYYKRAFRAGKCVRSVGCPEQTPPSLYGTSKIACLPIPSSLLVAPNACQCPFSLFFTTAPRSSVPRQRECVNVLLSKFEGEEGGEGERVYQQKSESTAPFVGRRGESKAYSYFTVLLYTLVALMA